MESTTLWSSLCYLMLNNNFKWAAVTDDKDERALSIHNQKIYEELAKHKKSLDKLKNKVSLFFKIKHRECSRRRSTRLTIKKSSEPSVMEMERNEPVKIDSFLDEASEPKSSCTS
ncbi:hypothetical protein L6452_16544 [Arctium lappa]|uniref:Uncharacterized protein n=1 Tax=Arctium lappa TaxID=4217 RepID=A0ACB9C0U2_ARCLA|nr:hypothetical protein L6452_16544 [Arctium lappa]